MNLAALFLVGQVHAAPDPCRLSEDCKSWGECVTVDGECAAARTADCELSEACRRGRCTALDGKCVAASEGDCRGSAACANHGKRCHFNRDERGCDDGTERASTSLWIGGIVVMGLGGAAMNVGGILTVYEVVVGTTIAGRSPLLGPAIIGAGAGLALLVGMPMTLVGARGVTRESSGAQPTAIVSPGGAALRWRF